MCTVYDETHHGGTPCSGRCQVSLLMVSLALALPAHPSSGIVTQVCDPPPCSTALRSTAGQGELCTTPLH